MEAIMSDLRLLSVKLMPRQSVFHTHPALHNIWENPEHTFHAVESFKAVNSGLDTDGDAFLIIHKSGPAIGVTGWFPIDETRACMRWHGITPRYRGQGHGRAAVDLLIERIKAAGPYTELFEAAETARAARYFRDIGFVDETDEDVRRLIGNNAGTGFKHFLKRVI